MVKKIIHSPTKLLVDGEKKIIHSPTTKLSVACVPFLADCGRSYISLMDTRKNFKRRLPLTSDTTLTPLVLPRHVIATGPSTLLVCDQGKKAAVHVSTEGRLLFTYTGRGNQRLVRPEGLCADGQGHVFLADSGDHSVSVLTRAGSLYSKTRGGGGGGGGRGGGESDLNSPQALCVDRNSCLYVATDGGKELSVYDIIQEG